MTANKTVVVTGGGNGIGRAISRAFLHSGYQVIIAQRGQPDVDDADWIATDLRLEDDCNRLIDEVITRYGRLDALINNAGVMEHSTLENTSLTHWDNTLAVNLRAPFLLTRRALPLLRAASGCIVNIGSIEGLACNPGHSAYAVSKAGLHALTRATAVDHGREIRCNAIAPGWINTELNERMIEARPDPGAFRRGIESIHPVGRTGTAEEIAGLAVFLCSPDAGFICGQTFTVDGGRTVQLPLPP